MLDKRRETAFALGLLGIVAATGGYVCFSITRMLFTILRGSYSEARRSMLSVSAKINGDDPGTQLETMAAAFRAAVSQPGCSSGQTAADACRPC